MSPLSIDPPQPPDARPPEPPTPGVHLAAGWRLAIYVVMVVGLNLGASWALTPWMRSRGGSFDPLNMLIGEALLFGCAALVAAVMGRIEGRSFGNYGLPPRLFLGKLFWQGAALGLVEVGAIIGFIALLGGYHFGQLALHGRQFWLWGGFYALFFMLVGLGEEFNLRGYPQFTLTEGIGFWPAAIVLSCVFGGLHVYNPGENWIGILDVVLSGLLWCFTLRRTGSLWFAVGMHAAFDFGETFLFSVRDSGVSFPHQLSHAWMSGPNWLTGGAVGPEGTFFDPLLLLLFFYVVHRWFPAKPGPPVPQDTAPAASSA